ncbi:halocin C8-like domain-containing protein [Thermococcus thermotolerans]|uniref:halocin C8-like domain-containing protein n=1 Tax=Thermococcus thermotolerans TaxID=2969672 RepID=UPI002157354A|nr:halocin C8-like domain-containing protein [Thermococcus thermotolerans]
MMWKKTAFGVFLVAMVLSLQLIAAPQAMAMSVNNSSVTFRRAVIAWYDDKGRLQMNVTWVNKTIDFSNLTNSSCACHNSSSCSVVSPLNVSIVTLYNMSKNHEQLLFLRINLSNSTFNYTMYALIYKAERSQYNFTLITKIFTDPQTGEYKAFVTGMNIAPNDEDKVVPVGDTIITADNLTLSEYYWTLNKVLMKLRRGDETNWIWGRSAYELRHLSHRVRLKLLEYNQGKAIGMTTVMDGYTEWLKCTICTYVVTFICQAGVWSSCTGICGTICLMTVNPFAIGTCLATCAPICWKISSAVAFFGCAYGAYNICSSEGYCQG